MLITNSSFMKSRFLFLLFLFYSCYSIAQISNADKKQISKIIGEDFIMLPNQKSYPYCDYSDSFKVDMSTSILNDTVGVSFHNEHLLWHDLISFCGKEEVLKLAKPSYVTVEEYLEFQNWVRDLIYEYEPSNLCIYDTRYWTDEDSKLWINYSDYYWDTISKKFVEFDPTDHALGRSLFSLNWNRNINYKDKNLIPILNDLYLPSPERFYRLKEFDERKLVYNYSKLIKHPFSCSLDSMLTLYPFNQLSNSLRYREKKEIHIQENTCTLIDRYSWAQKTQSERDDFSTLSQTYCKFQKDSPIIGLNGPQAKAFCHWKQTMLQKELDEKELTYKLILTLPTGEDHNEIYSKEILFTIAEKEYTSQWKISNNDYELFREAVRDSVLRDFIYINCFKKTEKYASKFISFKELYFDEGTLEYAEFDYSDRLLGRSLFPLNYKTKIKNLSEMDKALIDSFKKTDEYINPFYIFDYLYTKELSYAGKFEKIESSSPSKLILKDTLDQNHYFDYNYEYYDDSLKALSREYFHEYYFGKDLDLSYRDVLNQTTSVRSFKDLSEFIIPIYFEIKSIPFIYKDPDAAKQNLTYDEALAYYSWKYPIHNPNPKDDWQKFVLPSKEQFEAVQSGKQVIVPEKKVAYPTPLFRYVVHVYPK